MQLSCVVPLDGRWVGEQGEGSRPSWTGSRLAVQRDCDQRCASEKPESFDLALSQGLCSSSHACQGGARSPHTPRLCLQPHRHRRYRPDSALLEYP